MQFGGVGVVERGGYGVKVRFNERRYGLQSHMPSKRTRAPCELAPGNLLVLVITDSKLRLPPPREITDALHTLVDWIGS